MFPIYNEIDLAVKKLPEWMKDETRGSDAILAFRTASAS